MKEGARWSERGAGKGKHRGGSQEDARRKMELPSDQWPVEFSRQYDADFFIFSFLFLFLWYLHIENTYFSLACESEGTDDPFPFAYMVAVVAGQSFST